MPILYFRLESEESTASFWSNMSVTNAISNISTSLSRVLSAKVSTKRMKHQQKC